ncbi:hypothetical protein PGANDO_0041 [Porphyromonas gingivalis]|nr:hypothetical protein PGANDO_0041 [Porphyromonas gingivalis]
MYEAASELPSDCTTKDFTSGTVAPTAKPSMASDGEVAELPDKSKAAATNEPESILFNFILFRYS